MCGLGEGVISSSLAVFSLCTFGFIINSDVQAAKYTAKIGHLESAKQPRHKTLEIVADLIKKRTNVIRWYGRYV